MKDIIYNIAGVLGVILAMPLTIIAIAWDAANEFKDTIKEYLTGDL